MTRHRPGAAARLLALAALLPAWGIVAPPPAAAQESKDAKVGKPTGDPAPDTKAALELIDRRRYDEAIVSAKRALGRDERYTPAMMAMAKAYYYLKKYELSTSIIEIAQKIKPDIPEAYQLLGFIALTRDDRISATAAFKKAVEVKPDFGNAWNNLAAMYLYAKNYDAAVDAAQRATDLQPRFDKAWLNLGSALRGKARYDEAERAYRKALEFNSKYSAVYFDLGILYLDAPQMPNVDTTGRLNQAIAHFARYKDFIATSGQPAPQNDPVDAYVEEARKALVLEAKRIEREKKKKERAAPKAPPAEAPPAAGADRADPGMGAN